MAACAYGQPDVLYSRRGSNHTSHMQVDAQEQEERLRTQALARYFTPVQITADTIRSPSGDPVSPTLSNNTHLTGLAQLGALRLNCDRSFISLLDSNTQYIIAEATRTISLKEIDRYSIPQDALCLGVQALNKLFGICPNSVAVFTDASDTKAVVSPNIICNRSRYMIHNLTELEEYKDKPYVVGFPYMRSYLEVPLKTPSGRVIGGYCVIDNVVRDDFNNDDVNFVMNEIATSIMDYLELVTVRQNHDRGERLMEGLSLFTEGKASFASPRSPQPGSENPSETPQQFQPEVSGPMHHSGSHESRTSVDSDRDDSASANTTQSSGSPSTESSPDLETLKNQTPITTPSDAAGLDDSCENVVASDGEPPDDHVEAPFISKYSATFSRAASLIREAMDMDGLAFLDGIDVSMDQSTRLRNSVNASQSGDGYKTDDDGNHAANGDSPRCQTLGYSVGATEGVLQLGSSLAVSEHSLRHMVKAYPTGCVLSVNKHGVLVSSALEATSSSSSSLASEGKESQSRQPVPLELQELQELLSGTRSAIFYPLWDVRKEQFFAGLLGWTGDPTRVFEKEDFTCLSAFGDSVMTELGRLEAVDLSRGKSNFISSVSHELRSPLHGILAGAELLRDALKDDDTQSEMVRIIETCGTTLLDTLNHLLDFAKINNLDDPKGIVRKAAVSAKKNDSNVEELPVLDLGELMQDVVEGVYFGYISKTAAHRSPVIQNDPLGETTHTLPGIRGGQGAPYAALEDLEDTHVAILVDLDTNTDWQMPLHVGAWKRIIMNIFANALKYTRHGQIELCLKKTTNRDRSGSKRDYAEFTVSDSGIGMSPEYLKHQLFKPFAQENPLADGTGLGLSIVKQIINNLDGTIEVRSEVGVGTRIQVMIPITSCSPADSVDAVGSRTNNLKEQFRDKTLSLVSFSDDLNSKEASANVAIRRQLVMAPFLTRLVSDTFAMRVIRTQNLEEEKADFHVAEASFLMTLPENTTCDGKRVLSIGTEFCNKPTNIQGIGSIKYPIGPRNFKRALLAAMKTGNADSKVISATNVDTVIDRAAGDHEKSFEKTTRIPTASDPKNTPPIQGQPQSKPGKHLLLVDDNVINLKVLSNYVKKLGCTYATAENGLEAVTLYKLSEKPFDIVFMDISMPVMNGFEASRCIREFELGNLAPDARSTRIIALTGLGSEASRQEAVASGIDEFRIKPVPMKELKVLLQPDP